LQDKNLQKAKPDFAMTSIDLQRAFEDNEAVSIAKYANKIIEVTGTIESVKAGEGNITNVALKTGSELSSVICTLSSQSDPAALVSGREVTIRGECSGFLLDVLLNNCVVIK
jgi:tRNA 2-selenouridine synthase SelU